jgi:hypothetical protein
VPTPPATSFTATTTSTFPCHADTFPYHAGTLAKTVTFCIDMRIPETSRCRCAFLADYPPASLSHQEPEPVLLSYARNSVDGTLHMFAAVQLLVQPS